MDPIGLIRTVGALGVVLGMLGGALWAVRRFDLKLPGRMGLTGHRRRIEVVERLALDNRRALALVRRDDCEHLILLGPEGTTVIERGRAAAVERAPVPERQVAPPPPPPPTAADIFAQLAALRSAHSAAATPTLAERVADLNRMRDRARQRAHG